MKKYLLALILAASSAYATDPSGSCLTWLGYNAGQDGNGNYSSLIGAYSGMDCSDMLCTSAMGVMSAFGSQFLDNCFAAGFRALQDSSDNYDVIAIGNCAGRGSANAKNCLWFGRDVGRSTGSEWNTIRFLNDWYSDNGVNYIPDGCGAAEHVYFFGISLYNIINAIKESDSSNPSNLSDFTNDCGFMTGDEVYSIITNSNFVKEDSLTFSCILQGSALPGFSSTMKISELTDYAFVNYNCDYYSMTYGIRFNRDDENNYERLGFSDSTKRSTRVIEEVKENSIVSINANASLLAHDGSTVWLQDPNDVLVGGTNKTSAAFLPNYVRSIANVQSVNGKTGAITLNASDVNALPAFSTNTVVRLITDDDAYAAIRLILTTMGATVVTNTSSASN